jgi:hypothetical protein
MAGRSSLIANERWRVVEERDGQRARHDEILVSSRWVVFPRPQSASHQHHASTFSPVAPLHDVPWRL